MSIATQPRPFNQAETQRRVRHPLQTLRGYIRSYVILEGLAIAVIFLALWFWIGLALDWGVFQLWAFDWVQEMQALDADTATPGRTALLVRAVLLGLLSLGLIGLVAWKVLFRITREFSDSSLALVLERRFPKDLGDRLITAVEMADPKLVEKYGYSRTLIEKTIQDAADRVEMVPVKEVFNWARLYVLGMWCGLLTVGMYVLVGIVTCVAGVFTEGSSSPFDFMWRFNDSAGIWAERNLLLMDSYWPRSAHLEVVRFSDTPDHPGEMRVPRDEQRSDIHVRAYRWVIADRQAPFGWRPLRWNDLTELVDAGLLARVDIPRGWHGWIVDLDDLDPSVPAGVVPQTWHGLTAGKAVRELDPALKKKLQTAAALNAVNDLLDWHTWTVDKVQLQEEKTPVRQALRQEHGKAHAALQEVFTELAVLAESARYSRTLRRLSVPQYVQAYYRGDTTKKIIPYDLGTDNKYTVSLADLSESVRFTVRGEDFYTPSKKITLVPPPSILSMTVDKEEPAYLHHRLQGDQSPLRGKKQIFKDVPIGVMGDISTVQVPIGTHLRLRAKVDRPLKEGIRLNAPAVVEDRGAIVPDVPVVLEEGGQAFSIALKNVAKTHEFVFEFNDLDNVKGRRRVKIQPIDDRPPEIFEVELDVVLRKPRFRAEPGKGAAQSGAADGFLITPDAILPFKTGTLRDDHGLTRGDWIWEAEQVEFELIGQGPEKKDRLPTLVLQGSSKIRRAALLASGFQFTPATPGLEAAGPAYWAWMTRLMAIDLSIKRTEGEERAPLEEFYRKLARRAEEVPLNALAEYLKKKPSGRSLFKEHYLKDEDGFSLPQHLKRLKATDPKAQAQLHYLVKLYIEAMDNNVETGPRTGRSKTPLTFLVISENELLGQIAIEEESLRDRLDKAHEKLIKAKTSIDDQMGKLSSPGSDYSLIAIRVDEIRRALLDAGSTARDVHNDYRRVLREMEVNQIRKDKLTEVREKIVFPLGEVVDPNQGNFVRTEGAMEKLFQGLDDDQSAKVGDKNRLERLEQAREAALQLDRLNQRLNEILTAMDQGIVWAKLLDIAVNLEREQRQTWERIQGMHNKAVEDLLRGVIQN